MGARSTVLWDIMLHSLVNWLQHFEGTHYLQLELQMEAAGS
jgi:hypothetical protein